MTASGGRELRHGGPRPIQGRELRRGGAAEPDERRSELVGLAHRIPQEPPRLQQLSEHRMAAGLVHAEPPGHFGEGEPEVGVGGEQLQQADDPCRLG